MKKILLSVFLLHGCTEDVPLNEYRVCYKQNDDAVVFSAAVKKQGIPHVFNKDEKCIYAANTHYEKLRNLGVIVFGEPPPKGLSVSRGERNAELVKLLESNGIATKKYVWHGIEWIAWSYDDHQKAENLMKWKPWKREMNKRLRQESRESLNKQFKADGVKDRTVP